MRGEDERRSAKERGRGSKPRNALALGLRNVPFSFFPYIKKDSLLPPLEVILSTTDHQIYVGCQHTASGEVIERRANNGEKNWHETTSVFPKRGTNALSQKQDEECEHHSGHYIVQVQFCHLPHRFLLWVLTLHRDLLRALARCICTEQYRSTLLPRAL